eukprot:14563189-Ditylum_brightwellii.AAC.1
MEEVMMMAELLYTPTFGGGALCLIHTIKDCYTGNMVVVPFPPKAIDFFSVHTCEKQYMTMHNHHQGMFLATRGHLKAWRDKKGYKFDVAWDRPGTKQQHSEGTQRVWMSSQMMYGGRHCSIQQMGQNYLKDLIQV